MFSYLVCLSLDILHIYLLFCIHIKVLYFTNFSFLIYTHTHTHTLSFLNIYMSYFFVFIIGIADDNISSDVPEEFNDNIFLLISNRQYFCLKIQ